MILAQRGFPIGTVKINFLKKTLKGMKFALIELKIALVKLLQEFSIHPTKNTKILEFVEGTVRVPKHGIHICLNKRIYSD